MRIVFAGTPAPAIPTLERLVESTHEVVGVITRPPARVGRGRTLHPSPVAQFARERGLPVIEASSFKDPKVCNQVESLRPDLGVVVAYGALIPCSVLDMPTHGWINLHFSSLPRWRGAAPVQWALISGDTTTASSVFQLEKGLDTGPVYSSIPVDITHETAGELLERMAILGAPQVVDVVDSIANGTAQAVPQNEDDPRASHARQLSSSDGFVDFRSSAQATDRQILGLSPNPGAWTLLPDSKRLKLAAVTVVEGDDLEPGHIRVTKKSVEVGCQDGIVRLGQVAPAGKGWMDAAAWARGARLSEDTVLGTMEEN